MIGTIFDVKRFAVHDGQGLRTTLFLKGCPLRCPWCQNPEGIDSRPLVWHISSKCISCANCTSFCPERAISDQFYIDYARCTSCGLCTTACPSGAMDLVGKTITSEDAAELLLRDKVFYGIDGGITLSGGEVLAQWQFAKEILTICHDAGIDTAIETSLYTDKSVIQSLLNVVDHFIVDIKLMDNQKHKDWIGVDNHRILDNYRFLVSTGADILVRTPLIPGYTDSDDNIRSIAEFIYVSDPKAKYELLNFNPLCQSKYDSLKQIYPVSGTALSSERISQLYQIIQETGLQKYKE